MNQKLHQRGATLITVLCLLALIMIIGTLAIRTSMTSLNIATNAQAQQLLFQNNDAALFNLENPDFNKSQFNQSGVFGSFLGADASVQAKNKIIVSCFRGDVSNPFSLTSTILINENSLDSQGINGYCTSTSFSTSRSALISQVYVKALEQDNQSLKDPKLSDNGQVEYLKNQNEGDSFEQLVSQPVPLEVITVSIIPGLASVTGDKIKECFHNNPEQAIQCFSNLNVPYNVQYAHYLAGRSTEQIGS